MNNIIKIQVVQIEQKGGWTLRNNLKHLREDRGYTQSEFAKMLGISASHLNKIENNSRTRRNLTVPLALRAARILNVSLDDIFLK